MCQQAGVSRGQKEFEREANTAVNSIGATVSFQVWGDLPVRCGKKHCQGSGAEDLS
jgi:hypothetical protein